MLLIVMDGSTCCSANGSAFFGRGNYFDKPSSFTVNAVPFLKGGYHILCLV